MANAIVNRQVNVYINSGEAAKAYDVLIKREKLLNEELKKTSDPRRIQQLNKELDKLKEPIDRATKKMKGEMLPSIRDLELGYRKFLNEFKKTGSPEALAQFQKFRAELAQAKTQLNGLENSSKGLTSKGIFSGAFWGSFLAGGVTAALRGLGNLFRGAVQEALDADAATRRLESTLSNLGRSDAFDRISRKADELAAKFRYLDNDDIVGVFNKLIDYGKLTEKEMNDLLPVIIDFAAKSQVSIDESASVIIKALEGNGKALKEYGIDIKDAGNETDRLNLIMTTLKTKVDGAGESFQKSAKGGLLTARQELKNLQEDIGSLVIPALNKLLVFVVGALKGLRTFAKDVRDAFTFRRGIVDNVIGSEIDAYGDAAVLENEDFKKKISGLSAKDREKAIAKRIADQEYLLELSKKQHEQSKFDGKFNELKYQQDLTYHTKLLQLLKDEAALNAEVNPLGIFQPGGSDKTNSITPVKKIIEEVDLLAEALKKMYKVQEMGEKGARDDAKENQKAFDEMDKIFRANLQAINGNLGNDPAIGIKRFADNRLAGMELQVLQTRGRKRLNAELQLLKEQERQELENKTLTENEKLVIEEKYRQKRKQAETDYFMAQVDMIKGHAETVISVLTLFGQMATDKENAELERDRRLNDRKKSNLDRRLKGGLLTELQYRREVEQMDREFDKKEAAIRKKQFERQKRESLVQVLINGAEGISKTIAKNGFPAAIPFLIAQGVLLASQVAAIASQKAPEYAKGGTLGGRSHAAGGNAVIDAQGRKIAEVEAGEAIVNKRTMADRGRYSVSGTPSQIISRLNSMHGTAWEAGATLIPGWRSYRPAQMNYAAMKGVYAAGGRFDGQNAANNAPQDAIFQNFSALLADMQATNQYLANILAQGIKADVSLLRFEEQQDRLDAIREDATMVG